MLADQQALQNQVRNANQRADEAIAALSDRGKMESVLARQLEAERKKVEFLEMRISILNGVLNMRIAPQPTKPVLDSEQWRRLVQLCHPDKHGGSEAAVKATQWLQEVRP